MRNLPLTLVLALVSTTVGAEAPRLLPAGSVVLYPDPAVQLRWSGELPSKTVILDAPEYCLTRPAYQQSILDETAHAQCVEALDDCECRECGNVAPPEPASPGVGTVVMVVGGAALLLGGGIALGYALAQ